MPKRKSNDSDSDDYILRKIKKLERKLLKRKRKRSSSLSSVDSNQAVSLQEEPAIPLDDNILEMLGENPSKNKKFGPPIQAELAVRWEHIATTGLSKDIKKELLEKYFLPENCIKIGAPSLNPEVKAALSDTLVKKDKVIQTKQNQQAISISCISQALTKIFASETKDAEIIKLLIDGVRLLCDYQHTETMSRRSFVTSTIKKDIKDHLYATEIDNFLFGEKLAETLKSAKAISKSAAEMKTISQQKTANFSQAKFNQPRPLNGKPPLPLTRQPGAGRGSAPATHQPRRYQAHPPPPPPPTARHQPPQQAPPQRSRARTQTRR
ncbi:hypothetical protein ABMA27_015009 [Loxostege sticticalis]|uniref:Uncharacterized protein n=1 Tax=Loxostege sticticalis TaxID=481309 RepID=A0ABR3IAY7_LOXSC